MITQFKITALADKPMREAIGGVCVYWAILELMVERVIANLEGNPEVVTYSEDMGHRTDTLKHLAKASSALPETDRTVLCAIASEIKTLAHDRHRIAHGLWGMDADGNLVSMFPRAKVGHPNKPMTREDIRQVKLKTWEICGRLTAYVSQSDSAAMPWPRKPKTKARPDRQDS